MSQVIRQRPLRRSEYWRLRMERLYYRAHANGAVLFAFFVAFGIGMAVLLLLRGLMMDAG